MPVDVRVIGESLLVVKVDTRVLVAVEPEVVMRVIGTPVLALVLVEPVLATTTVDTGVLVRVTAVSSDVVTVKHRQYCTE